MKMPRRFRQRMLGIVIKAKTVAEILLFSIRNHVQSVVDIIDPLLCQIDLFRRLLGGISNEIMLAPYLVLYRAGHRKKHPLDHCCINAGEMGNGLCYRLTNLFRSNFTVELFLSFGQFGINLFYRLRSQLSSGRQIIADFLLYRLYRSHKRPLDRGQVCLICWSL